MELYRGSRIKTDTIKAQEVLPFDLTKLKKSGKKKVIWASPYKEAAWIFGIFWQRMSVKISVTNDNAGTVIHKVQVSRELTAEELNEDVYLYTLDGATFKCVSKDNEEYFSFENELPAQRDVKKVKDILNELVSTHKVEIKVNPELAIKPAPFINVFKVRMLFAFSLLGLLFAGYLSAVKLFKNTCAFGEACPYFLGYPACYYGFFMYLLLFVFSLILALNLGNAPKLLAAIRTVSLAGIVFAGYFTLGELPLFFSTGFKAYFFGLPTCSLGLIFYVLIFSLTFRSRSKVFS